MEQNIIGTNELDATEPSVQPADQSTLIRMPFELLVMIESYMSGFDSIKASLTSKVFLKASMESPQWQKRIKTELSSQILEKIDKTYLNDSKYLRKFYLTEYNKELSKVRDHKSSVLKDFKDTVDQVNRLSGKIQSLVEIFKANQNLASKDQIGLIQKLEVYTNSTLIKQIKFYQEVKKQYSRAITIKISNSELLRYNHTIACNNHAFFAVMLDRGSNELVCDVISHNLYYIMMASTKINQTKYDCYSSDIQHINIETIKPFHMDIIFQRIYVNKAYFQRQEIELLAAFLMTYAIQTKNNRLCNVLIEGAEGVAFFNASEINYPQRFSDVVNIVSSSRFNYHSIIWFPTSSNYNDNFKLEILRNMEIPFETDPEFPAIAAAGLSMVTWPVSTMENHINASFASGVFIFFAHVFFCTLSIFILAALSPIMLPLFYFKTKKIDLICYVNELAGHLVILKILSVFADSAEPINFTWKHVYTFRLGVPGMLIGASFGLAFAAPIVAINILKHTILSAVDTFLICFGKEPEKRTDKQKYLAGGVGYIIAFVPAMIARAVYEGCVKIGKVCLTTGDVEEPLLPHPIVLPTPALMEEGAALTAQDNILHFGRSGTAPLRQEYRNNMV